MGVTIHQNFLGMLEFHINSKSGLPVYRQILDQIKFYAASGVLETGSKLPSIRALSRSLAVNPSTVVKAYSELEHQGIVENRQGKGAFLIHKGEDTSDEAKREALRGTAREVWIQADQLGASETLVREVFEQEFEETRKKKKK